MLQKRSKKAFFISALTLVAGAFALTGCGEQSTATQQQANRGPAEVPVPVETVKYSERVLKQELPGRIDAVRLADVSARVTGILLERKFEEGAKVEKGQVLFQIDPAPQQAARDAAAAQLAGAKAALESAEITFKRYSELVESGGVSRQAYDDARIAVDSCKASVLAAEANLKTAEIDLGYTEVTSPISGIVGAALVTEGALVSGTSLTKMAVVQQMDPINFDFMRSATSLLELRAAIASGRVEKHADDSVSVSLVLEDGTTYPHAGTLKFSEVSVDKSTGMYKLRAEFPNPDNILLPGMFARAILVEGVDRQAILVPQKAVSLGTAGKASIFVADENDMVSSRAIQIGEMDGQNWVVKEGLKPGDRILTDGLIAVGMAFSRGVGVKVVPPQAAEPVPAEAPAAEAKELETPGN